MTQHFLRVVFSPGIAPDKWFGRFDQRVDGWAIASAQADDPLRYIDAGAADIAIVRLGVPAGETGGVGDLGRRHKVHLYDEQIGIAAPKDHPIKMEKSVQWSEVGDETIIYSTPSDGDVAVSAVREALQVVAANVGVALVPRPLLRGINQPGVVHRDVHGVPDSVGRTAVELAWLKDRDDEVIQDFVGICRGRKEGSSRHSSPQKAGASRGGGKNVGVNARSAQRKEGGKGARRAKGARGVQRGERGRSGRR